MNIFLPRPGDPDGPRAGLSGRLNRLRAGVLGANDGIVSTAGLVVGVAGATTTGAVLTAGSAGLVAGAVSMALGEYVSVSSQRDTEKSLLAANGPSSNSSPPEEPAELAGMYRRPALGRSTPPSRTRPVAGSTPPRSWAT